MKEVLSYRNQFIDLKSKSIDWFLYDRSLHYERVKTASNEQMNIPHKLLPQPHKHLQGMSSIPDN